MDARSGVCPLRQVLVQPAQLQKSPPCSASCGTGADVRGWVALVAQRAKLGLSAAEAYAQAWASIAALNPFPATLGRVCPHPCEASCNRSAKDGAVSINALERFLGDWALAHKLRLPLAESGKRAESAGVIGAGPAGLSFAYQMARRGYAVTIYEKQPRAGGMLHFGIPEYRLPEAILQAEINRILALGVELKLNTAVGRDVSLEEIHLQRDVLFVGIGAGLGLKLGIPGEEGAGVWNGTEFLARFNCGNRLEVGDSVVVVGGGNTAMDVARAARRLGAQVNVLYRRTRKEMPAIASEIDDALAEGVTITYLAAPCEIVREDGRVRAVRVQRMELGEPDEGGRRRPVAIRGSERDIPASAVIAAVSQQPDWQGLAQLQQGDVWARADDEGRLCHGVWSGGDAAGLGIAAAAIAQGRRAAEAAHAQLRSLPLRRPPAGPVAEANAVRPDYYPAKERSSSPYRPVPARLAHPELEVQETISEASFLDEAARCFSCGSCFGCQHCFMYCNAAGFSKLKEVRPGEYFALSLDGCESCGKCIEICPCGYLSPCAPSLYTVAA